MAPDAAAVPGRARRGAGDRRAARRRGRAARGPARGRRDDRAGRRRAGARGARRSAPRRRRAARPAARLAPAGRDDRRRDRRGRPGRRAARDRPAAGPGAHLGLDGPAVRAALAGLLGGRRLRGPAHGAGGDPGGGRRRGPRQPAARRDAGDAAEPLAVLALEPPLPLAGVAAGRGRARAPGGARRAHGPDRRDAAADRPRAGPARPGVGGQARRARAAVAAAPRGRAGRLPRRAGGAPGAVRAVLRARRAARRAVAGVAGGPAPPGRAGDRRRAGRAGGPHAFWCWVQLLVDEQLAAATAAATACRSGSCTTSRSGSTRAGADAWALQDALALGTTVGAPPDSFNQQGQDWGLPPWRPDRLREPGYAPYRDARARRAAARGRRCASTTSWACSGCGGCRPGARRRRGHVRLLRRGRHARRARARGGPGRGARRRRGPRHRRGPGPRRRSTAAGVLGSAVLWFETRRGRRPVPPGAVARARRWRASPPTTCRPPPASWPRSTSGCATSWASSACRSSRSASGSARSASAARHAGEQGLLEPRTAGRSCWPCTARSRPRPCRVVLAALGDAVGDLRQPNLPGTVDQYPNWRLPVADGAGRPLDPRGAARRPRHRAARRAAATRASRQPAAGRAVGPALPSPRSPRERMT